MDMLKAALKGALMMVLLIPAMIIFGVVCGILGHYTGLLFIWFNPSSEDQAFVAMVIAGLVWALAILGAFIGVMDKR